MQVHKPFRKKWGCFLDSYSRTGPRETGRLFIFIARSFLHKHSRPLDFFFSQLPSCQAPKSKEDSMFTTRMRTGLTKPSSFDRHEGNLISSMLRSLTTLESGRRSGRSDTAGMGVLGLSLIFHDDQAFVLVVISGAATIAGLGTNIYNRER